MLVLGWTNSSVSTSFSEFDNSYYCVICKAAIIGIICRQGSLLRCEKCDLCSYESKIPLNSNGMIFTDFKSVAAEDRNFSFQVTWLCPQCLDLKLLICHPGNLPFQIISPCFKKTRYWSLNSLPVILVEETKISQLELDMVLLSNMVSAFSAGIPFTAVVLKDNPYFSSLLCMKKQYFPLGTVASLR